MKKIILAGASLNSGNKGINALTRGQIDLILSKNINVEIEILSFSVDDVVNNVIEHNGGKFNIVEYPCKKNTLLKAYIKSKLGIKTELLKKILESDIILDISEGDSFSDIYGNKRFIQHSIIKLIAINKGKKIALMPQTLGPFKQKWVKFIAKRIINKATYVFVRDDLSRNVAKNELGIKRSIEFVPDMAFYMKPNPKIQIDRFLVDGRNHEVIGLNVSALLYNGGYTKNNMFDLKIDYKKMIDKLIDKLMNETKANIILIPHVMTNYTEVEDDFRVCKKINEKFSMKYNGRIYTIDKHYKEDEIKNIISGCDFFIGSRMHACIGAISTKVPTVPISYSRKFLGVWDKMGLGYCVVDPKIDDENQIIEKIFSLYADKDKIKQKLEQEIPENVRKIEEIIDTLGGI